MSREQLVGQLAALSAQEVGTLVQEASESRNVDIYQNIPVSTLQDLLERANALKEKTFDVEVALKIRIQGTIYPEGTDAYLDDLIVTSTTVSGPSGLDGLVDDLLLETLLEDPYSYQVTDDALSEVINGVEELHRELSDLEADNGLEEGDLVDQLAEKTGLPLS